MPEQAPFPYSDDPPEPKHSRLPRLIAAFMLVLILLWFLNRIFTITTLFYNTGTTGELVPMLEEQVDMWQQHTDKLEKTTAVARTYHAEKQKEWSTLERRNTKAGSWTFQEKADLELELKKAEMARQTAADALHKEQTALRESRRSLEETKHELAEEEKALRLTKTADSARKIS